MKQTILPKPTPIFANKEWKGDAYNYAGNLWAPVPYTTIASTTSDISLGALGAV